MYRGDRLQVRGFPYEEDALAIAAHVDERLSIDQPVNVHLTGCHHSCAQHYIGDIGLIGAKVPINDDGDTVPGYDVVIGGGFGNEAKIGAELCKGVKAEDIPAFVERLLRAWQTSRASSQESFHTFASRVTRDELARMVEIEEALT
jgi:ferredoxin-nitrite reductase